MFDSYQVLSFRFINTHYILCDLILIFIIFRIDPGIKSTVYCVAIAEGGIDEWEFAWNQYQTANVAAEQSRLLSALSCSKETWILSR